MQVIADTHVHLYDCYDLAGALRGLADNLAKHVTPGGDAHLAACLTEPKHCNVFEQLRDATAPSGITVEYGDTATCLIIETPRPLLLYSGFQIITQERLEVLALVCKKRIPDGKSAANTIAAVSAAGGVPVLPWSPGKWSGSRGKTVHRLISEATPGALTIGDPAMRPKGLPEPSLFRLARARHLNIVAGSDPLPFGDDATSIGRYASNWEGLGMGASLSTEALRGMIQQQASGTVGSRNHPVAALTRWVKNARLK